MAGGLGGRRRLCCDGAPNHALVSALHCRLLWRRGRRRLALTLTGPAWPAPRPGPAARSQTARGHMQAREAGRRIREYMEAGDGSGDGANSNYRMFFYISPYK